jgi:hypothetical protein
MNKLIEGITTTVQIYPTATTGKTGSASVDMSNYRRAVAKLFAHRLPDKKGEGVITLSIYENVGTGATGSIVTASVKTASITSVSDVLLESEVESIDLSKNTTTKRYINAYVASATATNVVVTIERGNGRYDPQ